MYGGTILQIDKFSSCGKRFPVIILQKVEILVTIQSHADLYKIGCSSLLDKDYFYKSIWREAINEQKKSLEKAILRIGFE